MIIVIILAVSAVGVFEIIRIQQQHSTVSVTISGNCSTDVYPNGVKPESAFHLSENSVLEMCVRFFWYGNLTTVDSSQFMVITAYNSNQADYFNEDENFTVSSDPASFQIGGNSDMNEGLVVTYQIQARANSEGSYMISSLGWLVPSNEQCGPDYVVVVGSGIPNYVFYGSCIASVKSSSTLRTFDNSSFYCPSSVICTEITGSNNETN